MIKIIIPCLSLLLLAPSVHAANTESVELPLKPADFAYGMMLETPGQEAMYQVDLPLAVYQNTLRSDLGDLRIFNANAEIVPHMFVQIDSTSTQPTLQALVYFPLYAGDAENPQQLNLRLKIVTENLQLDLRNTPTAASSAALTGYLLDTGKFSSPIQALQLQWSNADENFVGEIKIESSDDLKTWQLRVGQAPLASLNYAGHSLLQNRIDLPPLQAKYLRLTWPTTQAPLTLTAIQAESVAEHVAAPLSWIRQSGVVDNDPGVYLFDLGAHLALRRVRFELPQANTLVNAMLLSRASVSDAWQTVGRAVLYNLSRNDQQLNSPDILVNTRHRYWQLRVDQDGGGLGVGVPVMHVGWLPQQLVFVARGLAPFQMAYGHRDVLPMQARLQQFYPEAKRSHQTLPVAQIGQAINLGGASRLTPPAPALPWKTWLLWLFLGVAVMLLGWMAYRLMQQMNVSTAANEGDKPQ